MDDNVIADADKSRVRRGLLTFWRYTCHPNYFGDAAL
jgi:steroid 5-alpha reductase family enzyme